MQENPNAVVEDLERPGIDEEPEKVQLQYEDAYQYKRIFEPLVAAEADYDRRVKQSQTQSVGHVRWDVGLNKKPQAFFHLPKFSDGSKFQTLEYLSRSFLTCLCKHSEHSKKNLFADMKLMLGDELLLKHSQTAFGEWSCVGSVIKIPDSKACLLIFCVSRKFALYVTIIFFSLLVSNIYFASNLDQN